MGRTIGIGSAHRHAAQQLFRLCLVCSSHVLESQTKASQVFGNSICVVTASFFNRELANSACPIAVTMVWVWQSCGEAGSCTANFIDHSVEGGVPGRAAGFEERCRLMSFSREAFGVFPVVSGKIEINDAVSEGNVLSKFRVLRW
jgi:hypothetical protein